MKKHNNLLWIVIGMAVCLSLVVGLNGNVYASYQEGHADLPTPVVPVAAWMDGVFPSELQNVAAASGIMPAPAQTVNEEIMTAGMASDAMATDGILTDGITFDEKTFGETTYDANAFGRTGGDFSGLEFNASLIGTDLLGTAETNGAAGTSGTAQTSAGGNGTAPAAIRITAEQVFATMTPEQKAAYEGMSKEQQDEWMQASINYLQALYDLQIAAQQDGASAGTQAGVSQGGQQGNVSQGTQQGAASQGAQNGSLQGTAGNGSQAANASQAGAQTPAAPATFTTVNDLSYFNDACFIGDSFTQGLEIYSKNPGAHFYYSVGAGTSGAYSAVFSLPGGGKGLLFDALPQKQYKKIYLLMGINEIGNEKGAAFAQKYLALIQKIQAVQPNATIFIQSILHTTQKKSSSTGFKNELINDHNAALSALADNKKIFYIDLNPLFDDANGAMRGELSGDGVHLKAQHYITWRDYLMTRVPTTLVQ